MDNERFIIDLLEFVTKELDRYGEVIRDHNYKDGSKVKRVKDYIYNERYYSVKCVNGSIENIYIGGVVDE